MKLFILAIILLLSGCKGENVERVRVNTQKNQEETKTVVQSVIGEAFTQINDKEENRMINICLACSALTESVLKPGEELSFNQKTGKRSTKAGYKEASVIVDGEHSRGIGGGVCQVSTTIYMAAQNSGLEITELHHHSKAVNYAPSGGDATVVYGVKDLKIKNNTSDDIHLYVWTDNEKIFAKFIKNVLT